jgi:ATP-dependent protease ClpP protease subunit
MVERVLRCDKHQLKRNSFSNLTTDQLLKKTNYNSLYVECDGGLTKVDQILRTDMIVKPILFHPASITTTCEGEFMYNGIAMIPRIQILSSRIPTYSVLDSIITMDDYLPMLFCTKRYMYEHSHITINMLYMNPWSPIFSDMVYNRELLMSSIKKILASKTKLPAKMIENIDKRIILLNAAECLKYKLCDEIIRM